MTPNSGLTYKKGGAIGSYKMHDLRDQVVFHDGFSMQFRAGETTSGCGSELLCPNQFCKPNATAPARDVDARRSAEVAGILASRADARAARQQQQQRVVLDGGGAAACSPGPIAYGFGRPGGDGTFGAMKLGGKKCSGGADVNKSGCDAATCAKMCCGSSSCRSWVHGIASGCDQSAPKDPHAVCCWLKTGSPQISVKRDDFLSSGEVAGHGGSTPTPGPGPPMPPAPKPPAGVFVQYNTLVFSYQWPSADTPSKAEAKAGSLRERLEELRKLLAEGLVTRAEHDAARKAALGIN